ncbi:hypothetical protein IFR05_007985 [Cadophora sp. M221]|nr:hypothetical protein IFR05_007985 [Cadophora sp. M221]
MVATTGSNIGSRADMLRAYMDAYQASIANTQEWNLEHMTNLMMSLFKVDKEYRKESAVPPPNTIRNSMSKPSVRKPGRQVQFKSNPSRRNRDQADDEEQGDSQSSLSSDSTRASRVSLEVITETMIQ